MSIIHPLSKQEIRASFTHRGWFAFCPVTVKPGLTLNTRGD